MRGGREGGPDGGARPGRGRAGGAPDGRGAERLPDRVDWDPDHDPSAPVTCEVCGGEMVYTASCKLKCPRCGYMRDCSDP